MKSKISLLLLLSLIFVNGYGQNNTHKKMISLGIGFGSENNISNYGIFYSADLKLELMNRAYLNPRVGFFQSTGSLEKPAYYGERSHNGLFLECGFKMNVWSTLLD